MDGKRIQLESIARATRLGAYLQAYFFRTPLPIPGFAASIVSIFFESIAIIQVPFPFCDVSIGNDRFILEDNFIIDTGDRWNGISGQWFSGETDRFYGIIGKTAALGTYP
jgi:hypothetical protein